MNDPGRKRPLPSLRRYLILWILGCTIVMVFAYTQLLDYYLELGIDLRTQTELRQVAEHYAEGYAAQGSRPAPPTGANLAGYVALDEVPPQILAVFPHKSIQHAEIMRFANLDFDVNDEKEFSVDTQGFCSEGICELLFLYPFELEPGEWLYLVHGIVGSEEIYDELEFRDQFAVAVGSLFAGLLLLIAILLIRNVAAPVQKLNAWSLAQSADQPEQELPDFRFRELDTLAQRINHAFGKMREGITNEKLFLRHASHELRTPIAIVANNVELLDRLTDRPERSEAEQAAFTRQYRALNDIQLLVETLLWVNRQSETLPKAEPIDLRREVEQIVEAHQYLLNTGDVTLSLTGQGSATVPAAAARIVLSNLVRNAFQYTHDGEVRIAIEPTQVTVENTSLRASEAEPEDDAYGFGLGLELVGRICKRLDWTFDTKESPGGRKACVRF